MDKVSNNKVANKVVNKANKKVKTKTAKTKTVRASNNKVKPKTVNKANRVNRPTNNNNSKPTTRVLPITMVTESQITWITTTTTMVSPTM